MAGLLPDLLIDAAAHDSLALTQVAFETSACLHYLGYRHLALPAAKLALTSAHDTEQPAWIGAARFICTTAMPVEAAASANRIAARALTDLQAIAAQPEARQVLGLLHLSAALACAADRRTNDAQAHLAEAANEAATLGDPDNGMGFNRLSFGATNVGIWRMAVAVELGEHGRVIELARTTRPENLRVAYRHQAYWMSLGRALAHSGRTDREALVAFARAERAAPTAFEFNPMVHDAIVAHRAQGTSRIHLR
jgi:hypothetical protein